MTLTSIVKEIEESYGTPFQPCFNLFILHILGKYNAYGLRSQYKKRFGKELPMKYRTELTLNSDITYPIKFGVYRIMREPERFKGHNHELRYLNSLGGNTDISTDCDFYMIAMQDSELQEYVSHLAKNEYPVMSRYRFEDMANRVIHKTKNNVTSFAVKKLIFLQAWGMSVEDVVQDISTSAYRSMLNFYPKIDTELHAENIFKNSVRQAGGKLIQSLTGKDKNVFDEDGNYRQHTLTLSTDNEDYEVDGLDAGWAGNFTADCSSSLFVKEFITQLSSGQDKLLKILLGIESDNFEEWLKEHHSHFLAEYCNENYSTELIDLIRNFCQVTYNEYLTMIDGLQGKRRQAFVQPVLKRC